MCNPNLAFLLDNRYYGYLFHANITPDFKTLSTLRHADYVARGIQRAAAFSVCEAVREILDKYEHDGRRSSKHYPDPKSPAIAVMDDQDAVINKLLKPSQLKPLQSHFGKPNVCLSDICTLNFFELSAIPGLGRTTVHKIAMLLWDYRIVLRAMPENLQRELKALSPEVEWPEPL